MKFYSSCSDTIKRTIETKRFAIGKLIDSVVVSGMHIHECYEIYLSLVGNISFYIGGENFSVHKNQIFFINKYVTHHLTLKEDQKNQRIVIFIHPDFLDSFSTNEVNLSSLFLNKATASFIFNEDDYRQFLTFISRFENINGEMSELIETACFLEMMAFLYKLTSKQNDLISSNYENKLIGEVISYIYSRFNSSISLEDIASNFFISTSYLCRIFKKETGTTINKFIVARKIGLAKSLLSNNCSVSDAAEKSGFSDYSNFIRTFSKEVGISPKQYALKMSKGEL